MDVFSKKKRSRIMASIHSKNSKFERHFWDSLEVKPHGKLEFYPKDILGVPDAIRRDKKIAILLDSCFWHGCKTHFRIPINNREYWSKKN